MTNLPRILYFHEKDRLKFSGLLKLYSEMGFVWMPNFDRDTRKLDILGFFIRP